MVGFDERAVVALPPGRSLAAGGVTAEPGALLALSASGGIRVRPAAGRSVYFGRNFEDAHVGVGVADRRVSRRQGVLTHRDGRWWLANTGRRPLRLPGSRWLRRDGSAVVLAPGYTPLFVAGAREHLLELYVAGAGPGAVAATWRLTNDERLATVVLGTRFLRHEADPVPLTWQQATARLAQLQPGRWRAGRLEHLMADLRVRLAREGVVGLCGAADEPAFTANLLRELVRTATLVPPDLALLDPD
jgi:hypothetical protein